MKAYLLYKDRDFGWQRKLPRNEAALTQDLELDTLFNAMGQGDSFLFEVAKKVVLSASDTDLDTILYRQNILKDCLAHAPIVQEIYALSIEAIESEKKIYWGLFSKYPPAILDRSIEVLHMYVVALKRLRTIADEQAGQFESEGFRTLFAMLQKELSDAYFATIQRHLRDLKFPAGVLVSARLGKGNKGADYVLRKPHDKKQSWKERLFAAKPPEYGFTIPYQDENGAKALSDLKDRGINLVANALAQSCDHILSFFTLLRTELAFYLGCLQLHDRLVQKGEPTAFPVPLAIEERRLSFQGLYDVCLSLKVEPRVVGNDLDADHKSLVVITGANQGGKSTFLRAIGLAQLMMQSGMFAPVESFCASLCDSLFTHYKREEDTTMTSGKLDEELSRMSDIVGHITPDSLLLMNESFAATNEREGSEIARQIVCALLENHTRIFFVTHLYEFAQGLYDQKMETALFLRAQREEDGRRTFQICSGEPLQTSFGEDIYHKIFGADR